MSTRRTVASAAAVGIGIVAGLTAAPSWAAAGTKLCVPNKEGAGLVTPKHGKCKKGYTLISLGAEGKEGKQGKPGAEGRPGPEGKPGSEGKPGPEGKAGTTGFTSGELETLKGILPCIKSVKEGIGGKPTVQFSGCNVQVVNGEGSTTTTNGAGNLVIGYDEFPRAQTGSHDLILGDGQEFTSFGGLVAGFRNSITGRYASVSGGEGNAASNGEASVSGGEANTASGAGASVSGGLENRASGELASVSGGSSNTASGQEDSVSGGELNTASGFRSSVSGGELNTASGARSSVGGGLSNTASGFWSSVSGGGKNTASGEVSSVSGGATNTAKGNFSSIFGGHLEETTVLYEAKP